MGTRSRLPRIIGVTTSLVIGGALVGSAIGGGLLAILGLLIDGPGGFPYVSFAFEFAAKVGAIFGGIGLPFVSWTFLRHVPFRRIVAETAVGTVVGVR